MQNFLIVEGLQSSGDIHKCFPYFCLFDPLSGFEVLVDKSHEVSSAGELHDDTEIA